MNDSRKMRFDLVFLLSALALSAQIGHAEDMEHPLSEHDYLDEMPRVLTVSRLKQSVADSPSAVTVIDRETIRASGAVDLPELFRLVPGMYVGANAGFVYNTNHAVSYHGMTNAYPGNMQVLVNGRSVYTPLFGGVKWSELPVALMDIERIEVTRGPNAASYGANAFFATINIITQNPTEVSGSTALLTHGNGRNEAFYRHAGRVDGFAYRATVGYRQDDGFDRRDDFKRTRFLNAQTDYQVGLNDNLEFEIGLTDGERGDGTVEDLILRPHSTQVTDYHGLVRWKHRLSDTSDLQVQAYHSRERTDDTVTSASLKDYFLGEAAQETNPVKKATLTAIATHLGIDNLIINNDVVSERSDIEAQHTFTVGDSLRAVWGGSIRQDTMYAPLYLGTKKTDAFDLQRIFGHLEWRPNRMWTANAGAMLEHNDFTGTDLSPRASLNFKPSPDHTIRLGVSSALRTPNYIEKKFDWKYTAPLVAAPYTAIMQQKIADDGYVDAERIVSREIGYLGKFGGMHMDVRLFSDRLMGMIKDRDRVITAPVGVLLLNRQLNGSFVADSSANSGDAMAEGIELQTDWKLSADTRFLFNYAFVHIRETQASLKRNFTKSMPEHSLSMMLTHRFDENWDGTFAYYQVGKTTQLGDGDPVDLVRKSDLRIARKFKQANLGGEVSFVVENLFNSHYLEFADYNEAKRRARINLKLDF